MDRRFPRALFVVVALAAALAGLPGASAQGGGLAPVAAPLPPPPALWPPAGAAVGETARVRFVAPAGGPMAPDAFAVAYGPMFERILDELGALLPLRDAPLVVTLYPDDAAFAAATAHAPRPDVVPSEVVAKPGVGDVAVNLPRFLARSPLEAENLVRHAVTHVVLWDASAGRVPRGFDEGFAAYAEIPVSARLARSAALVQTAMQANALLAWSDLNRPQPPAGDPAVFAAHAYSMVAFLVDRQGLKTVGAYVTSLRDEPDWRVAMRAVYHRAPNELEAAWKENLPRWVAGGWRDNLFAAFDLQPARDLLAKAHYAAAKEQLERSLRLWTDLGNAERQHEVEELLKQGDGGLQAEALMGQVQDALEGHGYDRARTLLAQARSQYDQLPADQRPEDLVARYAAIADEGLRATADLESAQALSHNWRDYAAARGAAVAAGTSFARLGDADMLEQTQAVLADLDMRQRRIVILLGSLALLAAAWLALWLWARGGPSLDWGPTGGRVRPADDPPTTT